MANELSVTAKLSFSKANSKVSRADTESVDVTGSEFTHQVQVVGTTEEEIAQGADVGTPGYVWAKNLDATNYVEIGSTTGVYDIKVKAGEIALWRHNSATLYGKANTSAVRLEYIIIED